MESFDISDQPVRPSDNMPSSRKLTTVVGKKRVFVNVNTGGKRNDSADARMLSRPRWMLQMINRNG